MTKTIFDSLSAAPPARLLFALLATATVTRLAPDVTGFYDAPTGSIQYVVADPLTRSCAVNRSGPRLRSKIRLDANDVG